MAHQHILGYSVPVIHSVLTPVTDVILEMYVMLYMLYFLKMYWNCRNVRKKYHFSQIYPQHQRIQRSQQTTSELVMANTVRRHQMIGHWCFSSFFFYFKRV